jgi:hypothetical protein
MLRGMYARFDPMPETANDVALDTAIRPFIDRFIREDKRHRATALCFGAPGAPGSNRVRELLPLLDLKRSRTYAQDELASWHAVRGVFLVGNDAYSVSTATAIGLYVKEPALFIAYGATFTIVESATGAPLLMT